MYEIVFSRFQGAFSNPLPRPVLPVRGDPIFFSNVTKKLTAMNGCMGTHLNLEIGLHSELVLLKHYEPGL